MFDKTPASAPEAKSDIVIHTMPREFYGKEASVTEAPKAEVPAPVVAPPKPAAAPSPLAKPLPAKKSHAWIGYALVTLVFLGILGVGGYFAYVRVTAAQEQQRLAEVAAQEAEDQRERLEAERKRLDEERVRSEQQAAAAALIPVPGKDTDSDGLTDVEEQLYGTDPRDPDSDKDTFLDGNEVFHRYHPLGNAPATLLDTGAVRELQEPTYPYSLYYPSTWSVALERNDFGVIFKSSRQASITVTWAKKAETQTLAQWLGTEKGIKPSTLKETMTKVGYYGLVSEDDRTAYLEIGDSVAIMKYDLGEKNQIEYLQTFQMMVNSLSYVDLAP